MDIEALTKINELKEKGILTQEEFDKQKQILLNEKSNNKVSVKNKEGVNWKNVGISFVISLIYSIIILFIYGVYGEVMGKNFFKAICFVSAVVVAIFSFTLKSGKYQNCSSPVAIFFVVGLFGPLGIWAALYQFLQIKQGNVALKEGKRK